jgi:hypothetical protein
MSTAANQELAHHDRQSEQDDAQQIYNDKRRPTVLTRFNRETPYIAQTYGRTSRCKHNTKFAAKVFSFHSLYITIRSNQAM